MKFQGVASKTPSTPGSLPLELLLSLRRSTPEGTAPDLAEGFCNEPAHARAGSGRTQSSRDLSR